MAMQLSRAKFESLTSGLIQKTVGPCEKAVKDADISRSDISDVILVGGMTRMPKVRTIVYKLFIKIYFVYSALFRASFTVATVSLSSHVVVYVNSLVCVYTGAGDGEGDLWPGTQSCGQP